MNRTHEHLPFLDGVRGIAILAVFLYHCLGTSFGFDRLPWDGHFRDFDTVPSFLWLYPLTYGFTGVAVFFVVSGFCIHLSHQRSSNQGWLFFVHRRFFRIYPPYLFAVGLFILFQPWNKIQLSTFNGAAQLASHLFALHNLDQRTIYGINPSFWSIAVEVQLYVIYPLLLLLSSRLGWKRSLAIVGLIEFSIRSYTAVQSTFFNITPHRIITESPFAYWLSWSLGAYLAECFSTGKSSRIFSIRFEFVAIACLLMPLFKLTDPFTFLSFSWLTAIAISRILSGDWSLPKADSGLAGKIGSHLSFLGVISYSFYLLHQPLTRFCGKLSTILEPSAENHSLATFAVCVICYPALLIVSFLSYKFIEKPSIALGKAVWPRFQSAPPHRINPRSTR